MEWIMIMEFIDKGRIFRLNELFGANNPKEATNKGLNYRFDGLSPYAIIGIVRV